MGPFPECGSISSSSPWRQSCIFITSCSHQLGPSHSLAPVQEGGWARRGDLELLLCGGWGAGRFLRPPLLCGLQNLSALPNVATQQSLFCSARKGKHSHFWWITTSWAIISSFGSGEGGNWSSKINIYCHKEIVIWKSWDIGFKEMTVNTERGAEKWVKYIGEFLKVLLFRILPIFSSHWENGSQQNSPPTPKNLLARVPQEKEASPLPGMRSPPHLPPKDKA